MNETHSQLLAATRAYVTDIFQHKVKPEFVFHNLEHTEDVVEACSHMADYYQVSDDDRQVLMLAAWFHDTGYSSGQAEGHEDVSVQIATHFLTSHGADEATIQRVGSCIQATRMPQSPVSLTEKILCDADLSHLASEDFKARSQLLKQERENLLSRKIEKKEWRKNNIEFLEGHRYFTEYGQDVLEPKKQENLFQLGKKKEPKKAEEPEIIQTQQVFPYKPSGTVKDDKAFKSTERGAQTMFRTTSHNHLQLSAMADNKAHIMITVNSVLISFSFPLVVGYIRHFPEYMVSAGLIILSCLFSLTCAILATRPSISSGRFTEEDIRNKKTNLLFFGNFHQMQLQDYQWGMNQMLRDREYLYNTMIMDIYFLGVVLARKYRYLRLAYTVFMYGVILTVVSFMIAYLIASNTSEHSSGTKMPKFEYSKKAKL